MMTIQSAQETIVVELVLRRILYFLVGKHVKIMRIQ